MSIQPSQLTTRSEFEAKQDGYLPLDVGQAKRIMDEEAVAICASRDVDFEFLRRKSNGKCYIEAPFMPATCIPDTYADALLEAAAAGRPFTFR